MIKQSLFVLFFLCFYSCGNKEIKPNKDIFNEFIFSLGASFENYSLKFTQSDTFFIEKRFPEPIKRFYGIISDSIRLKLNLQIDKLNFPKFANLYQQESLQDGVSFKFYLRGDTLEKTVGIYGNEGPVELYSFAQWLDSFAKTVVIYPTSAEVNFGDLSGIIVPPAPPPKKL